MIELSSIEIEATGMHKGTIICLHGLGASGDDLAPLAQELKFPGVRWVLPHAPERSISINGGMLMRAWHDILVLSGDRPIPMDKIDINGINESEQFIKNIIKQEAQRVPAEKILLMGFSQGGALAVYTGIHYPEKLAGMVGMSCYPAKAQDTFEDMSPESKATPVFIGHGTSDDIVVQSRGRMLYDGLAANGYSATWHDYPMAHSICHQELVDLQSWLADKF